jgi:hypothetical protein
MAAPHAIRDDTQHEAADTTQHSVEVRDPRPRPFIPPVLVAYCACGWHGVLRTGRNADAMAQADGREHLERELRRSGTADAAVAS